MSARSHQMETVECNEDSPDYGFCSWITERLPGVDDERPRTAGRHHVGGLLYSKKASHLREGCRPQTLPPKIPPGQADAGQRKKRQREESLTPLGICHAWEVRLLERSSGAPWTLSSRGLNDPTHRSPRKVELNNNSTKVKVDAERSHTRIG